MQSAGCVQTLTRRDAACCISLKATSVDSGSAVLVLMLADSENLQSGLIKHPAVQVEPCYQCCQRRNGNKNAGSRAF